MSKPILLIIMDGTGLRESEHGNAFKQAKTPNFDKYWETYPHTTLIACGEKVGLPEGQMGNSEVGHLNIGAGRVVYQSLTLINKAIKERTFFKNEKFLKAIENAKTNNSKLHIVGLFSDGGVHAHLEHTFALLELAKEQNFDNLYIHLISDGRDVSQISFLDYYNQLEDKMNELGIGKIASISGRYYAMDRDRKWDRLELAYDAIVNQKGESFTDVKQYVNEQYENKLTDEFIKPAFNSTVDGKIESGDSVISTNFRPDRAIQIGSVLTNPEYDSFDRKDLDIYFVSMMKYSATVKSHIAFTPVDLKNTLGEVLARNNKTQVRIAETEKYPHVTFFFDGQNFNFGEIPKEREIFKIDSKTLNGAKAILVPSPNVATYDLQPEMNAPKVTELLLEELDRDDLDVVILNFANNDMVGHSGMLEPTIKSCETIDHCVGQLVDKVIEKGGIALVTADHGNADEVTTDDEKPMTAHTLSPVPFIITSHDIKVTDKVGKLADIAPTILELVGVEKPAEMDGESLIKK